MFYIIQLSNWNSGVMRSLMITDVMYDSKSMQISKLRILPTENSNRKLLSAAHDMGKRGGVIGLGLLNILIIQIFLSHVWKITKDNCLFQVKGGIAWSPGVVAWSFHGVFKKWSFERPFFPRVDWAEPSDHGVVPLTTQVLALPQAGLFHDGLLWRAISNTYKAMSGWYICCQYYSHIQRVS